MLIFDLTMTVDNAPELRQAFRAAIGITYDQERADARKRLQQASILFRVLHAVRTLDGDDEDRSREGELEIRGFRRLRSLIDQELGTYLRGPIFFYTTKGQNKQGFMYNFIFPGERVGEEGEVAMTYQPRQVWLKRGTEAVVETVVDMRTRVLHLPEGEGIVLAIKERTTYGWSPAEKYSGFATWYPDLTETPQSFLHPKGGETTWDSGQYPTFLIPRLPTSLTGDHRHYNVLVGVTS